jgi:hypothetical protein
MSDEEICDGCGLPFTSVREVVVRDPDGKVNVCEDCEDDLNAEIVREVSA